MLLNYGYAWLRTMASHSNHCRLRAVRGPLSVRRRMPTSLRYACCLLPKQRHGANVRKRRCARTSTGICCRFYHIKRRRAAHACAQLHDKQCGVCSTIGTAAETDHCTQVSSLTWYVCGIVCGSCSFAAPRTATRRWATIDNLCWDSHKPHTD